MPDKLSELLRSRKFYAALVAILLILVGPRAGIDEDQLTKAVSTLIAFIIGTALESGLKARNGNGG